jgi:hypothetical protein
LLGGGRGGGGHPTVQFHQDAGARSRS